MEEPKSKRARAKQLIDDLLSPINSTDGSQSRVFNPEFDESDEIAGDPQPPPPPPVEPGLAETTRPHPNHEAMKDFNEYVETACRDNKAFSPPYRAAVELMSLMNKKGGSLELYKELFEWHVKNLAASSTVDASQLFDFLLDRYNLRKTLPCEIPVKLPHSMETVNLACHDALAQVTDLLTDPRMCSEDLLFWNGDPKSAPPEEDTMLGDINTGSVMRETHNKKIAPRPKTIDGRTRVPLGFIFYIDGCQVGMYAGMNIEILKFTLSCFNSATREKGFAWRNLGYIPNRIKGMSQAKSQFDDSTHIDSAKYSVDSEYRQLFFQQGKSTKGLQLDASEYTNDPNNPPELPTCKAQDLHVMLNTILASYKQIESVDGFDWDLRMAHLEHISFVPFVLLVKVDGVEADKMCGQFLSKGHKVKCLCRQCMCPTDDSDHPYLTYNLKTKPVIRDLVKGGLVDELKNMSQQNIWNAWYELDFGSEDERSIHGATPMEPMHWIQINWFKYTIECLFQQTGNSSALSKTINGIAISLGELLKRQSDKDMPRTSFQKGIQDTHVAAHEMNGVLLVTSLTFRTAAGREALQTKAHGEHKRNFDTIRKIKDWSLLLETQMKVERWIDKGEHEIRLMKRANTKLREVMQLTKKVGKRQGKMGFKNLQFHGFTHAVDAALKYGCFGNVNVKANESHHRRDKKTAHRTQMQIDKFDMQCAKQIQLRHAVDLAMEEIAGHPKWMYLNGHNRTSSESNPDHSVPFAPTLTGAKTEFFRRTHDGKFAWTKCTTMQAKERFTYDLATLQTLEETWEFFSDYIKRFTAHTELKVFDIRAPNNRQVFRASPFFQGKPWEDWAMFDLSTPGNPQFKDFVPAQMKCFVDLTALPEDHGLGPGYKPGIYVIVEEAIANPDEEQFLSELWKPFKKQPHYDARFADRFCTQQLVHIEKLRAPAVLVPDLGNEDPRAYLRMVPRRLWASYFEDWLEEPHSRDYDSDEFED